MGCVSTGRASGNARRGISLQWLVALAIMLGMLLLGTALAWQGYRGLRQTLVAAAGDAAQQVGKTIDERARRLIDPAQSSIRLLAHNPTADTLAQRLESRGAHGGRPPVQSAEDLVRIDKNPGVHGPRRAYRRAIAATVLEQWGVPPVCRTLPARRADLRSGCGVLAGADTGAVRRRACYLSRATNFGAALQPFEASNRREGLQSSSSKVCRNLTATNRSPHSYPCAPAICRPAT